MKNKIKDSMQRRIFVVINYLFLSFLALTCFLPIINILAMSFSSASAVAAGNVGLWPVDFTLTSYKFVLEQSEFFTAFLVTIKRIIIGLPIGIVLTVLTAYPMSKTSDEFMARTFYRWFLLITMVFSGGLIPTYVTISQYKLIDSIWALILPGAVNVFNVILMMNFFRTLPKEMEEAAAIDGAGYIQRLIRIVIPVSLPVIATVTLFIVVGHWNSWFDGLIYMNKTTKFPLQSYLRTIIVSPNVSALTEDDVAMMSLLSNRTVRAAQIFVATVPILCIYPMLQRYFMTGLVMGSVKG